MSCKFGTESNTPDQIMAPCLNTVCAQLLLLYHIQGTDTRKCVFGGGVGKERQGKGGMGEGHRTLPMLIPLFDLPFRRMMNWHWCSLSSLSADESCSTSGINIASLGLSCASLTWLILMAWGYSWPRYGEGSNRRKTELMGLYSMSFLLMV